ncbi:MAG: accessory factor UbiK family protein [Xanthomonadales bacterium]|nr:accessory factor UbiK family protein [Xanthomonadales bacterium]
MIDLRALDELARRLSAALPPGAAAVGQDLADHLRAALRAACERLDFVSRAEFDVQRCVLLRTREKLELLEQRVAELEARLAHQGHAER